MANRENVMRSREISLLLLGFAILAILPHWGMAVEQPPYQVSFIRDVAPVLVGNCQACHGPKTAESNYRLDTFESLMRPGDFGLPPVTAGNFDDSEMYQLITDDDPHARMPNNGGRLTDAEIQTIAEWIRQGAKFDGRSEKAPLREQIPLDIRHAAPPELYPAAIPITAIAFTADGNRLLVGGYHELLVWDLASDHPAARIRNFPERTFGLAFTPDNTWLAVAGGAPGVEGEVRLIAWDRGGPKTGIEPKVLTMLEDVVFDVTFRPDGKQLAAAAADGSVRVFDAPSGAERLKISGHSDWVTAVCYSPDGKLIATTSRDKTAKVFDAETGKLLVTYSEHGEPVRAVAFAPDGKSVFSAGGSRIRSWNVQDAKLLGEMTGFQGDVNALAVDGENILGASADRTVRQFKLADRSFVRTLAPHPASVVSLAGHQASHRVCSGCFDGTVTIWNSENGTLLTQFLAIPLAGKSKN
jgi:WD40 repeat protein/mono/diheme cytochrome c family protein